MSLLPQECHLGFKEKKKTLWLQFKFPSGNYFFWLVMCKIAQQNSKIYSLREKSERRDITMYTLIPHHVITLRPVKVALSLLTVVGFKIEQTTCWWGSRRVVGRGWGWEEFHCPKLWFSDPSISESHREL